MTANDTLLTAIDLGLLNSPLVTRTGTVGPSDRKDFYKFTLNRNSKVDFALTGLGNDPAQVRLIADLNGDGIVSNNEIVELDSINDGLSSTADRSISASLSAGIYWAEVYTSRDNHSTAYTLTARSNARVSDNAVDPGNTLATAKNIGNLGTLQSFQDVVDPIDGKDYYKFNLLRNSQVSLSLFGLESEPAQVRIIADLNGDGIVSNNEIIELDSVNDGLSSTGDRSIVTNLSSGTYWAEVYTSREEHNTGYTLNASATPRTRDNVVDPGNRLATAKNIGNLGARQSFNDVVDPTDPKDYYQFNLQRNSNVVLSLTGLGNDPANVRIVSDLNRDGLISNNEIIALDSVNDGLSSTADRSITVALNAGRYWAEVYTSRDDHNSGYSLAASATVQPGAPFKLNGPDLNGDGKSDILLRNTRTGSTVVWNMNNSIILSGAEFAVLSTDWQLAATGDFNRDNNGDLFWRNQRTGENVIWRMNNARGITGATTIATLGTEWELATTGDFNSDGEEDLFWRNRSTGQNIVWYLDNGAFIGGKEVLSLSTDWSLEASGDFNGDGNEDLVWRNTVDGYASIWFSDGNGTIVDGAVLAQFQDLNWRFQGSADMNGDGQSDLLLRNFGDGTNVIWTMNGRTIASGSAFSTLSDTSWEMVV